VGELALAYAFSKGQLEAVQILVEAGAQVNAVEENPETGYRNTTLDCTSQYPEIAQFLRSRGALHLHELEPSSVEVSGV
jgi:ankyrin repeat protein